MQYQGITLKQFFYFFEFSPHERNVREAARKKNVFFFISPLRDSCSALREKKKDQEKPLGPGYPVNS